MADLFFLIEEDRMDIARYHRERWEEAGGAGEEDHKNMRRRRASLDVPEPDGAVHQEKVVLRYCSSQAIALEKQHHGGNFKRIRMQSGHHHLRNVNRTSQPPVEEEFMPVEGGGMMMELEMVMEFFNQPVLPGIAVFGVGIFAAANSHWKIQN